MLKGVNIKGLRDSKIPGFRRFHGDLHLLFQNVGFDFSLETVLMIGGHPIWRNWVFLFTSPGIV